MANERSQSSRQLQFILLLVAIVCAFIVNLVSMTIIANTKYDLQRFEGRMSDLMDRWHQLLQTTYRMTFSENTPEEVLADGTGLFVAFKTSLASFPQEAPIPILKPELQQQVALLVKGLEFGNRLIDQPYEQLRAFITYNKQHENTQVLNDSMYDILRNIRAYDFGATHMLNITRMSLSIRELGYSFTRLLEKKQDSIRTSVQTELKLLTDRNNTIQWALVVFIGLALVVFLIRLLAIFRELVRLAAQASEHSEALLQMSEARRLAEVRSLEAQVNPHFFYNTLNALNWLAIGNDQMEISRGLTDLAAITRYSISQFEVTATLAEEMEWLHKYLDLQRLRFGKSFDYEVHNNGADPQFRLYKLLFQPVIENAIIHGFSTSESGGLLIVSFEVRENRRLRTRIQDNGKGFDVGSKPDSGRTSVGMGNLTERLRVYYGDQATLEYTSQPGEGTAVCLEFPEVKA